MSGDAEQQARGGLPVGREVSVEFSPRGGWEIELHDESEPIACTTLDEARRIAYVCAARRRPCELIVHDAYHRLIHRQLVSDQGQRAGGWTRPQARAPAATPPTAPSMRRVRR
jgi:hypothetical protein